MAFRMNNDLKNLIVNAIIPAIAGAVGESGTGCLTILAGSQPSSAETSGTGGTLCVISNIGWGASTNGTSVFVSETGYQGTAVAAGAAGWARLELQSTAGTYRIDGDVGTAVGNVFTINANSFSSGGVVSLLSSDLYCA